MLPASHMADSFVKSLDKDDYIIDVPSKTIGLSDSDIDKAESYFKLDNLYDIENVALTHFIDNTTPAKRSTAQPCSCRTRAPISAAS